MLSVSVTLPSRRDELCSFGRAAITKYHRLGAQTTETYFLMVLQAGSPRSSKVLWD